MNNMRGVMRQLEKIILQRLILILVLAGSGIGQELISGSITYISRDQAYIDLGKKAGIQIGDSVQVYRNDVWLGVASVSQTSGASSAMEGLDPSVIAWDIGDDVQVEVNLPKSIQASSTAAIESHSESKPVVQVFLDSSSYAPRTPSNMSLDSDRFAPTFTGYVSTRVSDRGGDTSGVRETRGSIYGQFKVLDLGVRHLDVSTYLRSNRSSRDSSSQTGIYSIMLSYDNPGSHFSYLLGRMYHPQFSMLGTIDGLGMTWRSDRRVIAVAAGLMSNVNDIQGQLQRNKFGLLDEERFKWGKVQVGIIGETESGAFSRNYLLLGSTAKLSSSLRIRGYSEFDLDLQDQSQFQSTVSLTRFRASINWRPWRSLISTSRYSYRENVVDLLDSAETEYEKAARHTFNTNLSLILGSGMSITGQASFRGDGTNRQIQIYGVSLSHRNFTSQSYQLNAGGMAMFSYLSEGGRVYASIGRNILPWLDIDLYDEVFLYRILGESSFRIRHLPEISFSAKVPGLQRLRLRTRFEQENGELLYRFSLSASRQF
ncbi:MAG: hypothetical protein H8E26_01435 [FCB group bacterium]|nr:hypothetical protein [FCB group bacterium]MBL7027906.1 hypothetical protein [Candidatus Neomarinimicrobiota bacterium]MBL7121915.1 hypothetical protein [Candidatus Neomarinimicrobiota bacterium]